MHSINKIFDQEFPNMHIFIYELYDHGHHDWYEMIAHCDFDLHFAKN